MEVAELSTHNNFLQMDERVGSRGTSFATSILERIRVVRELDEDLSLAAQRLLVDLGKGIRQCVRHTASAAAARAAATEAR